jgi:hypothetical protein
MGTNIVIDDESMRETLRATGLKTKHEAVEEGCERWSACKSRPAAFGFTERLRTPPEPDGSIHHA